MDCLMSVDRTAHQFNPLERSASTPRRSLSYSTRALTTDATTQPTIERVCAGLFVTGGAIGLASLAFTGSPDRSERAVFLISVIAIAIAAITTLRGARFPLWTFGVLAATGTALVTAGTYYVGHSAHIYAFLYLWVLIFSAYFFGIRALLLQILAVGLAFAWILDARSDLTAMAWLIPISTMMVPVVLIYLLSNRLGRALSIATASVEESHHAATRLGTLIDAAPVAVIEVANDGRVVTWNRTAEHLFGRSASAVLNNPLPQEVTFQVADSDGQSTRPGWTIRHSDGTERIVAFSASVLRNPAGDETGSMIVAVDVTERRRLEQQLRETQKMEAIGRLAAGVAHDFNNILLAIRSYNWMLGQSPDPQAPEHIHNVAQVDHAIDRAATLTRQLLVFGQPELRRVEVIDLTETVLGMRDLLRTLIPEDVDLDIRIDRAPISVKADRSQIEQVLLNLAVNSRDAMLDGGLLSINVGVECDEMTESVVLQVTDTGRGIDPDHLRHIFEPFYTTKPDRDGAGFGLATVYGIVTASRGTIDVASRHGRGTTITIRLPLAAEEPEPRALQPKGDGRGSETILLVEDDARVREPLQLALERHGYRVVAASNGDDALGAFASARPGIDLVVTDVVMPYMSGPQLVDELRQTHPALPVLYVSGYPERSLELLNERGQEGAWALLQKPFTPSQLAQEIRRRLDTRSAA
jgi:two-component system cell cycle sensor histidine kinase/response regulator CckA